jgi:hypothetical protein
VVNSAFQVMGYRTASEAPTERLEEEYTWN